MATSASSAVTDPMGRTMRGARATHITPISRTSAPAASINPTSHQNRASGLARSGSFPTIKSVVPHVARVVGRAVPLDRQREQTDETEPEADDAQQRSQERRLAGRYRHGR